jgi:hypothetical protein
MIVLSLVAPGEVGTRAENFWLALSRAFRHRLASMIERKPTPSDTQEIKALGERKSHEINVRTKTKFYTTNSVSGQARIIIICELLVLLKNPGNNRQAVIFSGNFSATCTV